MKPIHSFVAAAALATLANSAGATVITMYDTVDFTNGTPSEVDSYGYGTAARLDGSLDFVSWTHDFQFVPAAEKVIAGALSISLRDDGGLWDGIEIAFGIAETGQWDVGQILWDVNSKAKYTYDVAVNSLLDGSFSVTLASLIGDFYIEKSVLKIDYTPKSVPEPATLSLLGIGLLGAAFGYRRRPKKA